MFVWPYRAIEQWPSREAIQEDAGAGIFADAGQLLLDSICGKAQEIGT